MKILVSFVNQVFTPELKLGVLDTKDLSFSWKEKYISDVGEGASGLVYDGRSNIYVCVQLNGLIVYDLDFMILQYYNFKYVKDAHSLLIEKDEILVVSSGTNQIYKLMLDDQGLIVDEVLFYSVKDVPDYSYDYVHLNSIAKVGKDYYASMFGKRNVGQSWVDKITGAIIRLGDNRIMTELRQPHTLNVVGDRLLVCESRTGNILDIHGQVVVELKGYVRGMTIIGNHLYVASSARRKISKSTKKSLIGRFGDMEDSETAEARIFIIDMNNFSVCDVVPMGVYGNEIYDLCILSDFVQGEIVPWEAGIRRIKSFEENFSKTVTLVHKQHDLRDFSKRQAQTIKNRESTIKGKESLIGRQAQTIENRESTIKGKESLIEKQVEMIKECETKIKENELLIKTQAKAIKKSEENFAKQNKILLQLLGKCNEITSTGSLVNPIRNLKAKKELLNICTKIRGIVK